MHARRLAGMRQAGSQLGAIMCGHQALHLSLDGGAAHVGCPAGQAAEGGGHIHGAPLRALPKALHHFEHSLRPSKLVRHQQQLLYLHHASGTWPWMSLLWRQPHASCAREWVAVAAPPALPAAQALAHLIRDRPVLVAKHNVVWLAMLPQPAKDAAVGAVRQLAAAGLAVLAANLHHGEGG